MAEIPDRIEGLWLTALGTNKTQGEVNRPRLAPEMHNHEISNLFVQTDQRLALLFPEINRTISVRITAPIVAMMMLTINP